MRVANLAALGLVCLVVGATGGTSTLRGTPARAALLGRIETRIKGLEASRALAAQQSELMDRIGKNMAPLTEKLRHMEAGVSSLLRPGSAGVGATVAAGSAGSGAGESDGNEKGRGAAAVAGGGGGGLDADKRAELSARLRDLEAKTKPLSHVAQKPTGVTPPASTHSSSGSGSPGAKHAVDIPPLVDERTGKTPTEMAEVSSESSGSGSTEAAVAKADSGAKEKARETPAAGDGQRI